MFHSAADGNLSFRDDHSSTGAIFIHHLCQAIMDHGRVTDFETIAKEVSRRITSLPEYVIIRNRQASNYVLAPVLEHCLLKKIYFEKPQDIQRFRKTDKPEIQSLNRRSEMINAELYRMVLIR